MGVLVIKCGVIGLICSCLFIAYKCVSVGEGWMPNAVCMTGMESGKYLENMQQYFVDVEDESNGRWWKWSFDNRWFGDRYGSREMSDVFKGVTGMGEFKKVCKDLYGKSEGELDERKKGDMWRYCSPVGEEPKTIYGAREKGEERYWNEGEGSEWGRSKREEVVSVQYEGNRMFWVIKEKVFYGGLAKEQIDESKKTEFDRLFDGKSGKLREVCGRVYGVSSTENGDGKVKGEDLVKYCGVKNVVDVNG